MKIQQIIDKNIEYLLQCLDTRQCPKCNARLRFDISAQELSISCPKCQFAQGCSLGFLLDFAEIVMDLPGGHHIKEFLIEILEEMKLQTEGTHPRR